MVMSQNPVLETWQFAPGKHYLATVPPDGCRDIIGEWDKRTGSLALTYSELDVRPRWVVLDPSVSLMALRLRPGVFITQTGLAEIRHAAARERDASAAFDLVCEAIAAHAECNEDLIEAARSAKTVTGMARHLGVTERTLHRRIDAKTGKPASFWLDLAKARRALAALASPMPLAEIALAAGYADQSHLTRSFGQRFGAAPGTFRKSSELMRLASQSGFSG